MVKIQGWAETGLFAGGDHFGPILGVKFHV